MGFEDTARAIGPRVLQLLDAHIRRSCLSGKFELRAHREFYETIAQISGREFCPFLLYWRIRIANPKAPLASDFVRRAVSKAGSVAHKAVALRCVFRGERHPGLSSVHGEIFAKVRPEGRTVRDASKPPSGNWCSACERNCSAFSNTTKNYGAAELVAAR